MRFEQGISNTFQGNTQLTLLQGKKQFGELHYTYIDSSQRFGLTWVNVPDGYRRRGYGVSLLREFVHQIGVNKPISGEIVHAKTLEALALQGVFEEAVAKHVVVITESERLTVLPIVQFLQAGGIRVDEVEAEYKKNIQTGDPRLDYQKIKESIATGYDDYLAYFNVSLRGST